MTAPRYDKYDGVTGGFRAKLAADLTVDSEGTTGVKGCSLDATGKVVVGSAGNSGFVGVFVKNVPSYPSLGNIPGAPLLAVPIGGKAGDVVDIMTDGEIVDVPGLTAGTKYYVESYQGALSTTATLTSLGTVTFTDTGDIVTVSAAHGLVVDDPVIVGAVTTTTGITEGVVYYVKTVPSTTTVTLSATVGGATLALTTDGSATAIYKGNALANTAIGFTVEATRLIVRTAR